MANFGDSRPNGSFPQNDTSHVDGYFRNEDDLYQLFGFTRDDNGEVAYRSGHEQIPANWYRRSTDYTHLDAAPCLQAMGQADPSIMIPGGNIGETNTFTPMDISNLTYGVYTEEMLSEWKNLRCFLYQVLVLATPAQGMSMVMFLPGGSIATTLEEWMCPKLEKLNKAMYDRYPGYKRKN
jgi:hypothetical protein